jgi:hypothetical protein
MNVNIVFFWDVTPCSLVEGYQHFGGTCCLQVSRETSSIFYPEDGGSRFFVNVGFFLPHYTASHPIIFITVGTSSLTHFCAAAHDFPVLGPQLYEV